MERERAVLAERRARYRGDREPPTVAGRTVILVDDGIATGGDRARRRAGAARSAAPRRIVLAVPVGPPGVETRFARDVDEVVCLEQPADFFAVGQAYEEFDQTERRGGRRARSTRPPTAERPTPRRRPTRAPQRSAGGVDPSRIRHARCESTPTASRCPATCGCPPGALGLVVFAHGSGSSRLSPRNVQVAAALNGARLATLLFDLLSAEEGLDRGASSTSRCSPSAWSPRPRGRGRAPRPRAGLPLGYFGASTGAAAALGAAAERPERVERRGLARWSPRPRRRRGSQAVRAPTLLIVGGADAAGARAQPPGRRAAALPRTSSPSCPAPRTCSRSPARSRASTELSADWFTRHLAGAPAGVGP